MQASDRILFLVTLYFPAKRVESRPAATFRIILVKLQLRCCEVQFSLGLLLILAWSYPVSTCVQSLGKLASVVLRCSRMQGMSSLHTVLADGITCAFHDEEVHAALCPMCVRYKPHGEKTASLKHRISGKQKRDTRPTARKIVKQKKSARRPRAKIKNVKETFVARGR